MTNSAGDTGSLREDGRFTGYTLADQADVHPAGNCKSIRELRHGARRATVTGMQGGDYMETR